MTHLDVVDEAGMESFPASDPPAWHVEEAPSPTACRPFELKQLPYGYADLEPALDATTVRMHHDLLHRSYVDGLNALLFRYQAWSGGDALQVLMQADNFPHDLRDELRYVAGEHINHEFFWEGLTPYGPAGPSGELFRRIRESFGSFGRMRARFEAISREHMGSGWTFLIVDPCRSFTLDIVTTMGHEPMLHSSYIPLLGCDLWEHAYCTQYGSRRSAWIRSFWDIVNWEKVSERLLEVCV